MSFRRAVLMGVAASVVVELIHLAAMSVFGRLPDWAFLFNLLVYAGAGYAATTDGPALARGALAGALVGLTDCLLALAAVRAAGYFPNQAKWGWLIGAMAVGGLLFGAAAGSLGSLMARSRWRRLGRAGA
jgi:hypothetical protein